MSAEYAVRWGARAVQVLHVLRLWLLYSARAVCNVCHGGNTCLVLTHMHSIAGTERNVLGVS